MLRLVHFPANNAWGFIFGAHVDTAAHIQLYGARMLFSDRAQAVSAAEYLGIHVDSEGRCTALDSRPEPTSSTETDG